jgi:hypothetical protein
MLNPGDVQDHSSTILVLPNARLQLLPEAGATQERRLEAVSCKALFGGLSLQEGWQRINGLPNELRVHDDG